MKRRPQGFVGLCVLLAASLSAANEGTCGKSAKPTGFTQVKDPKAYFYSGPAEPKKLKTYLVSGDFVQVLGEVEGAYSCAVFRNYKGHGGKQTRGWMRTDSLDPARTKLERKDLFARWHKSPCSEDSCVIDIAEENGKPEVGLNSYLHDRPGENYQAGSVEEREGRWVLTKLKGSEEAPQKIEIEFGKAKEPGTIFLVGPKGWAGTYHR